MPKINIHLIAAQLTLGFFFFFFQETTAQEVPLQQLRGYLQDATSQRPLEGASLQLSNQQGTYSDSLGQFAFTVPAGRYQLQASFLGYDSLLLTDVFVYAGKETVLRLQLERNTTELGLVTVQAQASGVQTLVPDKLLLGKEEVLRLPATYFDPARLAGNYPGVSGSNDQTNGLSVRGHSPNALGWRLQGAEIVNPNHTPNAGTASDRTTLNGGGVNILSAQLLDNSSFYPGLLPARYGNTLSGLLDMRLRPGNDQRWEYTLQAGLIGLDLAAEGPLSAKSKASVLANYRYSTVGILSALGMDLGDEEISFQDIAVHLNFPLQNGGKLSFFAIGGDSKNIFEAPTEIEEREENKDRFDIDFDHQMGAVGAQLSLPVGKNSSWQTIAALSGLQGDRRAESIDPDYPQTETDQYWQTKLNLHSWYQVRLNDNNLFDVGLNFLLQQDYLQASFNQQFAVNGRQEQSLTQAYLNWQTRLSRDLRLETSLRGYFLSERDAAIEPRLNLSWQAATNHQLSLSAGTQHQQAAAQVQLAGNTMLDAYEVQQLNAAWRWQLRPVTLFRLNAYFQQLENLPVSATTNTSFNGINLLEGYQQETLASTGTAENYGLEVMLDHQPLEGWYYLVSGSVYNSTYKGSDGIERDSRWNGNYTANIMVGREWKLQARKQVERTLGVGLRYNSLGGFRTTPIDVAASAAAGRTVFDTERAFSEQLDAFHRADLRIYLQRNRNGRSSMLALDIQNLTNRDNEAYRYYDVLLEEVTIKYQLGIIPLLSYRLSF